MELNPNSYGGEGVWWGAAPCSPLKVGSPGKLISLSVWGIGIGSMNIYRYWFDINPNEYIGIGEWIWWMKGISVWSYWLNSTYNTAHVICIQKIHHRCVIQINWTHHVTFTAGEYVFLYLALFLLLSINNVSMIFSFSDPSPLIIQCYNLTVHPPVTILPINIDR